VAASASTAGFATHALVPMENLKPGTQYFYAVTATNAVNASGIKIGSFKTLKRQVTIDIDKIVMVDDSDELGDCECRFQFFAGGSSSPQLYENADFATGDENDPNVHMTFVGGPLTLSVRGFDDDEGCAVTLCVCGTGGVPAGNGENDCGEWSETTQTILSVTMGTSEETSGTFILTANGGNESDLKFTVHGTYKVTYVP